MAKLEIEGIDELNAAFNRLSKVPDEVVLKAVTQMAEFAAQKIKESGETYQIHGDESVHILDKIAVRKPKRTAMGGYADVAFSGSRRKGESRTTNSAIAFLNEFGKRKQQARPFVGNAMNKQADAIAKHADALLEWMEKEFTK